jgi:hypothetical protein
MRRRRGRTRLAAAAVTMMLVATLVVTAGSATAGASVTPTVDPVQPVEVLANRTDRQTVYANPDGSYTMEQSVEPIRTRAADGSWVDIDPRLRLADDGVRPVATAADVRFSSGGSAPLAQLATNSGRLALSWPSALPPPVLSGDSATYPNVLPGVDLVAHATVDGFSHVVVVKSREAASNPALSSLRFGMSGGDLRLESTADGDLKAMAATGQPAVTSGAAMMWDSSSSPEGGVSDPTKAAEGARQSVATVRVDGTDLVIEPDQAMLTAPDTTYPVYIDPAYSRGSKRWGFTNSANESNDNQVRVGKSPDSGAIYRSFFTFDVSGLRGKHILRAQVLTEIRHSWSCANTPVSLYRGPSAGSGRVAWSGPTLSKYLDTRSGHAHKPSGGTGCDDDPQDNSHLEFGGQTTTDVQLAATSGWVEYEAILSARDSDGTDESATDRWKKFDPASTKLVVTYNSPPTVPTSLSTDGSACTTGTGRPVLPTVTPTFRAKVGDPDTAETDLRLAVSWEKLNGTTWQAVGSGQQAALRPGATGAVKVPAIGTASMVNGGIYRWRAQTQDPWSFNGASGTDSSAQSGWCEFEIDTIRPDMVPQVSSPVYGADLNLTYGSVGQTADFTFGANGVTDVVGYKWGWDTVPGNVVNASAAGGSVTLKITPPPLNPDRPTIGGPITLYVVSFDRTGRPSPLKEYPFNLGNASAPVGRWDLADPAGAAAVTDSSGGDHRATTSGGLTTGAPGRLLGGPSRPAATAATFDGVDDAAATTGPVLDTSNSFTVSAWVRPTANGPDWRTVVSQSGDRVAGFMLRRDPANKWSFTVSQSDVDNATHPVVLSAMPGPLNAWAHLVGVCDAGAKQIRLYVNGRLEATAPLPASFRATGALELGRGRWNGGYQLPWQGDLAEVKVWNRVLVDAEIRPMAATLVGGWTMSGGTGDDSPSGWTLSGTGYIVQDRNLLPDSAVALPLGESLRTAGPVLRTNQSFSVAGWVWQGVLDDSMAIGQRGSQTPAFYLGQNLHTWAFRTASSDAAGTSAGPSVEQVDTLDIATWVHLAGVYDAQAGELRLYVNGRRVATAAGTSTWQAEGAFAMGGGWTPRRVIPPPSTTSDVLPPRLPPTPPSPVPIGGGVDDVLAYQGVLSDAQIAALAAL